MKVYKKASDGSLFSPGHLVRECQPEDTSDNGWIMGTDCAYKTTPAKDPGGMLLVDVVAKRSSSSLLMNMRPGQFVYIRESGVEVGGFYE